jgi:O-antigen ligase
MRHRVGGRLSGILGLIVLLALAATVALPYGAVTPFGVWKLSVMAFAAAALAAWSGAPHPEHARISVFLLFCVALIGAIQLLPLGDTIVRPVAPVTAAMYADVNQVLSVFEKPKMQTRFSIAPTDTVRATLLICAYIACFIATAALVRTRGQRRLLIAVLLASAIAHVVWTALTQTDETRVHGAFVNPNHFAGYLEIALALAFAVVWTEIVTGGDRVPPLHDRASAIEKRLVPIAWRVLLWVVVAVGIALTRSRMGIVAAALTAIALAAAASLHARARRVTVLAAATIVGAVLIVIATTRETPFLRFLASDPRDPDTDSRIRLWRLSVSAWKEFPHFGSGLGTFREAFKRVQPSDFPGLYEQAHNDALQLLVTGGWTSLALAATALLSMLILLLRGWRRQRHREERAVTLAAAGALASLLIHGIAEFNFSIPAIPATLAIVLGLGWSAAHHDTDTHRRDVANAVVIDRAGRDSG